MSGYSSNMVRCLLISCKIFLVAVITTPCLNRLCWCPLVITWVHGYYTFVWLFTFEVCQTGLHIISCTIVLTGNTVNVNVNVICSACLGSTFLYSPHDNRLKPVCPLSSFRCIVSQMCTNSQWLQNRLFVLVWYSVVGFFIDFYGVNAELMFCIFCIP